MIEKRHNIRNLILGQFHEVKGFGEKLPNQAILVFHSRFLPGAMWPCIVKQGREPFLKFFVAIEFHSSVRSHGLQWEFTLLKVEREGSEHIILAHITQNRQAAISAFAISHVQQVYFVWRNSPDNRIHFPIPKELSPERFPTPCFQFPDTDLCSSLFSVQVSGVA